MQTLKNRTVPFLVLVLLVRLGTVFAAEDSGDFIVADIGSDHLYFSRIQHAADKLNRFLKENFETSETWRINFIKQKIAEAALAKRAVKEGLDKEKNISADIESIKQAVLAEELLTRRLKEVTISEDDLKRHYEANKQQYQIKEKIKIGYVKVKSKDSSQRIIEKLNKGKEFKTAIKGNKEIKVETWLTKDAPSMIPEIENIGADKINPLFNLGIGGTSEPIEKNSEFYIFHVYEKEPAQDRPFEEVKLQVENELSRKLRDQTINDFIRETFMREGVVIYEDRLKEDWKKRQIKIGQPETSNQ